MARHQSETASAMELIFAYDSLS